jgi:hypothetical protein
MDESIVERSVDVCNAENKFSLCDLRTERDGLLFLNLDFFGGLKPHMQ